MFQNCLPARQASKSNAKALVKRHNTDPVGNFGAPQARFLLALAALQLAHGTQAPLRQSRLTKAKIIPGQKNQS